MRVRMLLALALPLVACTPNGSAPAVSAIVASTTTTPPLTTTTEPPRSCDPTPLAPGRLATETDPMTASIQISQATFLECADDVVVARSDDPQALATGANLAAVGNGPLLVTTTLDPSAILAEIERLRPLRVTSVGGVDLPRVPETQMISAPVDPTTRPLAPSGDALWLVDSRMDGLTQVLESIAIRLGAGVVSARPPDLRALEPSARQTIRTASSVTLIGEFPEDADWQLEVVRAGMELPGGGQVMFPGRRLVALYGSPYSSALGALGEQDATNSVLRAVEVAAEYNTDDDVVVIPAFNLIATVASAGPGDDGDYSAELSVDDIRPWVEAAAGAGIYVVLDLQPGRTDFLAQAQRYEELLRLPNVGLALDPEWRLQPEQFHLRQVGSVTAAEINLVSEWLAGIVRDEALPQKLLVIHQFKLSMISERETLATPPELAVVVQMDGQGPLGSKFGTYAAVTADALDSGWAWGWKNFYDEDSPTATAEQTLSADPEPVFISYQ